MRNYLFVVETVGTHNGHTVNGVMHFQSYSQCAKWLRRYVTEFNVQWTSLRIVG